MRGKTIDRMRLDLKTKRKAYMNVEEPIGTTSLVNTVMNPQVPEKAVNFLTS
jgi:hypothetical protein